MNERELFKKVHNELLDYVGTGLKNRCAGWGLNTYELLKKNKRLLGTTDTLDEGMFIYAVSTAVIVGEFGKFAFGDYFPDDHEFDLDLFGLVFEDIKGYLDGYPDIDPIHLEKLCLGNYVKLEDIWGTMCEYKREMHKALTGIYKEQIKEDPDYYIFTSLLRIYEEIDTNDEDTRYIPSMTNAQEIGAYTYVSNSFQW